MIVSTIDLMTVIFLSTVAGFLFAECLNYLEVSQRE